LATGLWDLGQQSPRPCAPGPGRCAAQKFPKAGALVNLRQLRLPAGRNHDTEVSPLHLCGPKGSKGRAARPNVLAGHAAVLGRGVGGTRIAHMSYGDVVVIAGTEAIDSAETGSPRHWIADGAERALPLRRFPSRSGREPARTERKFDLSPQAPPPSTVRGRASQVDPGLFSRRLAACRGDDQAFLHGTGIAVGSAFARFGRGRFVAGDACDMLLMLQGPMVDEDSDEKPVFFRGECLGLAARSSTLLARVGTFGAARVGLVHDIDPAPRAPSPARGGTSLLPEQAHLPLQVQSPPLLQEQAASSLLELAHAPLQAGHLLPLRAHEPLHEAGHWPLASGQVHSPAAGSLQAVGQTLFVK